jgi:tetratricopeptide (TPR) repeat protein
MRSGLYLFQSMLSGWSWICGGLRAEVIMRDFDEAREQASELLRIDGVIGVGVGRRAGEDIILVELDRAERDLDTVLPGEIDGFAVEVHENRTYILRGGRLVSVDRDALELEEAQLTALQERIERGHATAGHYQKLLRILVEAGLADHPLADWEDIERLARRGVKTFPADTELLGVLLMLVTRRGDVKAQDAIMRRIAAVDPDSELLALMQPTAETMKMEGNREVRLRGLLEAAVGDDPHETRAAINELERWTHVNRQDAMAHAALGFGYARTGQTAAMLEEADRLAALAGDHHETHYNVAQLYAIGGQRKRARRHYKEALRLARTEEDREDARQGLARL